MSEGYQVINGVTNPAASCQDKVIARVVLAGWCIEPFPIPGGQRYTLFSPRGGINGYYISRYAAALAAENIIYEET